MTIRTSIHGNRIGLDTNELLEVRKGYKQPIETGSTGTTILAGGITLLAPTTAATFSLEAPPEAGVTKTLALNSTSTSAVVVVASGFIKSTAGSTHTGLTFDTTGDSCTLIGLSTGMWMISANVGVVPLN